MRDTGRLPTEAGRRDPQPEAGITELTHVHRAEARNATALQLLGISGSLRRESYNSRLLSATAAAAPFEVEVRIFEGLKAIPPFDEDDEADPPAGVVELRAQLRAADAVLIASPEYNGSLPGQLKNALDWASRPYDRNALRGKPVAVIGASPSPGGTAHANADARRILARIGACVCEQTLLVSRAFEHIDAGGRLTDPTLNGRLAELVSSLVAAAAAQRVQAA